MHSSKKWASFEFAFLALLIITILFSPGSANAQLSAGSVTGTVRDASGSAVADASVTLRNIDTTIDLVRARLSVKFSAPAAVVARY